MTVLATWWETFPQHAVFSKLWRESCDPITEVVIEKVEYFSRKNTMGNSYCKEMKDDQPADVKCENPHQPELYVAKFIRVNKLSLWCFPIVLLLKNIDGRSVHVWHRWLYVNKHFKTYAAITNDKLKQLFLVTWIWNLFSGKLHHRFSKIPN